MGDGPLTIYKLVNLAEYITNIRGLEGYERIKKRLYKIDDTFYPTISEIEFVYVILNKCSRDIIHLEYTFKTHSGKNPELKVDYNSNPVYFEVTSITDYKEMDDILKYYNLISGAQLSLKYLFNINREITITFKNYPNKSVFKDIYDMMNLKLSKNKSLIFKEISNNFSIDFKEGSNVIFKMPKEIIENKLKDKIDEETKHFDEGDYNFVVIDVTPIMIDIDDLGDIVRNYFFYSENKTILGVIFLFKGWTFEKFEPVYKRGILYQGNPLLITSKAYDIIDHIIFPNSIDD